MGRQRCGRNVAGGGTRSWILIHAARAIEAKHSCLPQFFIESRAEGDAWGGCAEQDGERGRGSAPCGPASGVASAPRAVHARGAERDPARASCKIGIRGPACKPGSVPASEDAATVISLAVRLPVQSSSLPESRNGPDQPCSHIWPCSRWGLPSQPVTRLLVGSYIKRPKPPHHFTLTAPGVIPGAAVSFCCTFPVLRQPRNHSRARLGRWALPTTASCGARTFLPLANQATTVRPARGLVYHI